MSTSERTVRTYSHWRRPRSAGLFGLGSVATGVLLAGLVVMILVVMTAGVVPGLVVFLVLVGAMSLVAVRDRHGQTALQRTTTKVGWWRSRAEGANGYRSGPLGRVDWGTNQLPGLAAQLRLSEYTDSYGRPFALVYAPSTGHYSVVIGTDPDGAALVDPEQVDNWVAEWGQWLAALGNESGVAGASVTIETAPDTGRRLSTEVEGHIDPDAPSFAQSVLREVVASYPSGSASIRAYVTLTFSRTSRAGGRRRDRDEMGRELGTRLPGLTGSLSSTGAGAARPLSAQRLCEVIRTAYDPAAGELIDEAHQRGEAVELRWPNVGPVAAQAGWSDYRHDSALSRTWQMTIAPRGLVQDSILTRFLSPHRDIARKRVTLVYRPIDAGRAAAIVEADLRAASFNMTSSRNVTARSVVSTEAAQATAREEASGAGLVNFGLFATATVMDEQDMPDAVATMENLSATARLVLRPAYGSQDSAFAAALPLGLVLPTHVKLPTEF